MRSTSSCWGPGINAGRLCCGALICICSLFTIAFGQANDVWLGGNGSWSDPSLWSNGVPNGNVNVLIDNGNPLSSTITLDISPSVDNLTIDSDDQLFLNGNSLTVNNGSITVLGELRGGGDISGSGNVFNQGIITGSTAKTLTIATAVSNEGTITSDRKRHKIEPLTEVQLTGGLTNTGIVEPGGGALLNISGPFSNFSGTTLKGGTYKVDKGSLYGVPSTLQFTNANIVTNSANIIIGPRDQFIDQFGNDALRNFANNTSGAVFDFGGRLTASTDFSNAGMMNIRGIFQVNSYTQTAGTTSVRTSLSAPSGMTIAGGALKGRGNINANVVSSGSVTPDPGAAFGQPHKLMMSAYTQTASGSLIITIDSDTLNNSLVVTNGVSLNGTLNIKRARKFLPTIGDTFTILTGSAITGQFATVNGLSINSNEHFQIAYNTTSVTLTVVSGAK